MKKTVILLLFLMGGLIVGALLTYLGQSVSFLWWLTLGDSIGFGYPQAVTLDLSVIRLNLGFYLKLNVAQMIGLIAAMAAYFAWGRKL